jgi:hypothetical protein
MHKVVARIKMVKNRLIFLDLPLRASSSLFVEKHANIQLLATFSASISQFFPHFYFSALQPSSSVRGPLVHSSQSDTADETTVLKTSAGIIIGAIY